VFGDIMLVDYDDDHYNYNNNNNNHNNIGLSQLYACLSTEHEEIVKIMFNGV